MRIVHVKNLKPNMTLAKAIYQDDKILLNTGCENLYKYKNKLLSLNITYIYVNDQLSTGIKANDVINDETRRKSQKLIKEIATDISYYKRINIDSVTTIVKNIITDIVNNNALLINLIKIETHDEYTFSHSINVTVLSILLGHSLGYNRRDLLKLGIGAILHDIGKLFIPKEILNKKGKLNNEEFQIIKKHPSLGYKNIENTYAISPISRIVILAHHEKVNGSGYPKGLTGDNIHEFAKVVSITDVFDALTSDRCYRSRRPISEAVDFLISNSNTHFDRKLVQNFINHIAIYPNGLLVKLSTGENAIIKEQNSNFPSRPIVKVITDSQGHELEDNKVINLMKEHNVTIIEEKQSGII